MAKMNKITPVAESCLDMTIRRLGVVFDRFDKVIVAFSGGKDSTACLNLTAEAARRAGRLPLTVISFDEEAIPPQTVEYMARAATRSDIDFRWYCVPIEHRNACSTKHPYWYPWAPEDREKWVRELPPLAITDFPGFVRGSIASLVPILFPPSCGTVANIMGIRTQESITRLRTITTKKGESAFMTRMADTPHVTNVYPIYDWKTEDVWKAPDQFGWDYNRAYDVMQAAGFSLPSQRCAPPYGEQPIRGLHKFKTCWPDLWAKMVYRVPGAATAARYANTELYGVGVKSSDRPAGMSWQEAVLDRVRSLPPESRREVSEAIDACFSIHKNRAGDRPIPDEVPDPLSGICWKTMFIGAQAGGNKFNRQMQKMQNAMMIARRKHGVTK